MIVIEQSTIDNKPVTLVYLDDDFELCDKAEATLVKVIFEDGSNVFTSPEALKVG